MQKNEELDYDTLYNGRGEEILGMVLLYFENDIKLLSKEEILPDRPERDNVVGVKYKFELHNDYIVRCTVNLGVSFMVETILGEKVYITEVKYMTWDMKKKLGFKTNNKIVEEKLDIFNNVIQTLRNGNEIEMVGIENN